MASRSDDEVEAEVQRRIREIEVLRRSAQDQGLRFAALEEDELRRKVTRESTHSPYFFTQSWTSGTTPGASAIYEVSVANPDPTNHFEVFVTVFFGMANFVTEISLGLAGRHPGWPYISSAPFGLAAGASTTKSFNYTVPQVLLATYTGNSVLWRGEFFDQGTYFDRGLFYVSLH